MPHAEQQQQQQQPYVHGQFYTTKYTLLILIVLHLITVLFYATLALNFISRPELSRAYTDKEADAAKPKVLAASAIGVITSCTGFLALSTWHIAFTGIFAFLCVVSSIGYHFCALNDPVVEPLSSMHLFPVALAVILLVLTAFYASLQVQMGVLEEKPAEKKRKKKKRPKLPPLGLDTELQLYNFIAESKSAYYVRQTLVAATVLHIAWTGGYLVERVLCLHRIGATNETIETDAEIDLEVTMQNSVLSDACYSQSALATLIVLTGDLIGLVGVFRQKSIQLVACAGTLVFGALYRFIATEDSELFYWLNMFFSVVLLTVNTTFAGLLLVYGLASTITQESTLAATISATSTQAAMDAALAMTQMSTTATAVGNRKDEGGGGGQVKKKKKTKEKKAKKEEVVAAVAVKEKEMVKSITPSSGESSSSSNSSSSAGPSGTATTAAAATAPSSVAATIKNKASGKEATN